MGSEMCIRDRPTSISNFFNDPNQQSHVDEGGEELKVEFILSTGYIDIFQIIFKSNNIRKKIILRCKPI